MGARKRMARLARTLLLALAVLTFGFFAGIGAATLASRAGIGLPGAQSVQDAPPETAAPTPAQPDAPAVPSSPDVTYTAWDEAESPNYYRVMGSAVVGEAPAAGTVTYRPLDELGRATGAVACVTYDSSQAGSARERADTSGIRPSGWGHNTEVDIAMPDGSVYHGLLFNRSHLVAKSLGGEEVPENLICGTRTQNVGANVGGSEGGMAYAEGLVRDWLYAHHDGTVYYAATPVYEGSELLARSVVVDARSSDGSLDLRVEVYNAARGFALDYATGAFAVTEDAQEAARQIRGEAADATEAGTPAASSGQAEADDQRVAPTGSPEAEDGMRKVIVTRSGAAYHHDETCPGLANARSMEWVSVSEAEGMGRHPCGICGG